jgi:uncharacterized protein DUF4129
VLVVCTALVAVVALAARSHPLGTGSGTGSGLPSNFWDFAFTSLVIVGVGGGLLVVIVFFLQLGGGYGLKLTPYRSRTVRSLVTLIAVVALIAFVARHVDLHHVFHYAGRTVTQTVGTPPLPRPGRLRPPPAHRTHFRWEELAVVLAVLLAFGAVVATRSRKPGTALRLTAPAVFAAALDESIDDLRDEPDLRRAIVAAYARMERSLAAAGLPRRPAEAPLEYLARVLVSLDVSRDAVHRLTDLFEWARFSHHEPEPSMRDEAIDALVAVRDDLRAAKPVAA